MNELIADRTPLPFDWFFVAVFFYFAVLAFIRLQIPTINVLFLQAWQLKKQKSAFPKENNLPKGVFYLLIICSWLGFSLVLAEVLSFFGFAFPFTPLLFTFTAIFLYFSLKYLLKQISNGLLCIPDAFSEQMSLSVKNDFAWTLLALPLVTINHYIAPNCFINKYLIGIIGFIFCINFLQKFILSWILFFRKLKLLEILLYLCTIEILPLLLLARTAMNYF